MYINGKIVAELDDSDLSRFIRFLYKAVVLFDANVDKKYDFDSSLVTSLSSPVCETWHVPEYDMPLFRLLHIEEEDDRFVVLHYAKSKTLYFDVENPYDGSLIGFDYVLFFSYMCCNKTSVLNDNYSELYKILIDEKLLDTVETELEKIVLMNS